MSDGAAVRVAIVDYGLGNLFSVKHACAHAGLEASITADAREILAADAVILPGVGAYPDAMASLVERDLVGPLRDVAASGRWLVGICLGMQLFMGESEEFGRHEGLGLVPGKVVRFRGPMGAFGRAGARVTRPLKVPQIGWNRIEPAAGAWDGSLLEGVEAGAHMYFLHSFHCVPETPRVAVASARYGGIEFCAALGSNTVFACQFHPERSGPAGLRVYRNLARVIHRHRTGNSR
jgi:glutamine amidotransferase